MQNKLSLSNSHSKVRQLIEALGIKQRDFCDATGYSSGTVSQLYNGVEPLSVKAAWKIKNAYPQVNIKWLTNESDEIWDNQPENNPIDGLVNANIQDKIALLDAQSRQMQFQLIEKLTEDLKTASSENAETIRAILANLLKHT